MSDPTHLCRIGVGSVSANLTGWCRMCRIGVGSVSAGVGCVGLVSDPTHLCRIGVGLVSDRCRIGVGSVSDWCRMCRVVSASVGQCRLV